MYKIGKMFLMLSHMVMKYEYLFINLFGCFTFGICIVIRKDFEKHPGKGYDLVQIIYPKYFKVIKW